MKRFSHKFKAKAVVDDGKRFASQLEWKYIKHLELLKKSGEVLFWHRQPIFDLPGGVTYRADYQIMYSDGSVRYIDVKGMETEMFKVKKKMVEDLYPVEIEIVKKGDF